MGPFMPKFVTFLIVGVYDFVMVPDHDWEFLYHVPDQKCTNHNKIKYYYVIFMSHKNAISDFYPCTALNLLKGQNRKSGAITF